MNSLRALDVTLDTLLLKIVPKTDYISKLPYPVAFFLGYRHDGYKPRSLPQVVLAIWIFLSTFAGMLIVNSLFVYAPTFKTWNTSIVPPWAASAILVYNVIESPFAQPRSVVSGSFVSALVGVATTKLWLLSAGEDTLWVCGSLAVALASIAMSLTNCVHPPAGAVALIAATDETIRALGWRFLAVELICSLPIVANGALWNNVLRRYPSFWFLKFPPAPITVATKPPDSVVTNPQLVISFSDIEFPSDMHLTDEEMSTLNNIQQKLRGDLTNSSTIAV